MNQKNRFRQSDVVREIADKYNYKPEYARQLVTQARYQNLVCAPKMPRLTRKNWLRDARGRVWITAEGRELILNAVWNIHFGTRGGKK